MDALIDICEGFDRVDHVPKLTDSILVVGAVVVDIAVQPNEKDILDHLNLNLVTLRDIFRGSRRLLCFDRTTGMSSCFRFFVAHCLLSC